MIINGFEIPQGFKIVNPMPIDAWCGPYYGATQLDAVNLALSEIPKEIRYRTMQVRIIDDVAGSSIYWFKDGIEDSNLVIYAPDDVALNVETEARKAADIELYNLITGETQNRIDSDENLLVLLSGSTLESISAETINRINSDNILFNLITGETNERESKYDELLQLLNIESFSRLTGDTNLYGLITGETYNREVYDILLKSLITGETNSRILGDNNLYSLITGETFNRITGDSYSISFSSGITEELRLELTNLIDDLYNNKLSITGGTIYGNIIISGGTITGKGDGLSNIPISGITDLSQELNNKSDINHTHYQLFQPNGSNAFVYTDNNGNLHVNGNIIQSGSTYIINVETIYSSNNYIYLRSGSTLPLSDGEYTGFEAINYDGSNNGRLVFDKYGVARVGDVGYEQPLATREESPINNGIATWNSVNKRFETIDPLALPTSNDTYSLITGETSERISGDTEIKNNLINNYVSYTGSTKDVYLNNNITAESFIKLNGSSKEFLMADGSTSTTGDTLLAYDDRYVNSSGDTITGNLGVFGDISGSTIVSTIQDGYPGIKITSRTKIDNLNADLLDGNDSAYYVNTGRTINTGSGLTGGGNLSNNITISHADTSSSIGVDITGNSNGYVIENIKIKLDDFGHVIDTQASSKNLDERYYTENESDDRFVNVTGDTMSGQLTMLDSGILTDYIKYNTGSTTVLSPGTRKWNKDVGTTELMLPGGNVIIQDGFELILRVYNNGINTIKNGTPVTIVGAYDIYEIVEPAIASNHGNTKFIINGVATEDILPNSLGYIAHFGKVHDLDLSMFNIGDEVYLSQTEAGKIVNLSELSITGRTCKVGTVIDNSAIGGILRLDIINEDKTTWNTLSELNTYTINGISTGVFSFGGITLSSSTTFNISPMKGWIADNETDPLKPKVSYIVYSGSTGETTPYRTTDILTYLLVDKNSVLVKQNYPPTPSQRREMIYLGKVAHADKNVLNLALPTVDSMISPLSQVRDMFIPIPLINDGVSPYVSTGMTIHNTSGTLYGLGINFPTSNKNPNSKYIPASLTGMTFQYRTQTGGTLTPITLIDPTHWDNNGSLQLVPAPSKQATNQRIYLLTDGTFRVQYGQTVYSDLNTAKLNVTSEKFIKYPGAISDAILIGILSIESSANDLSDPLKSQLFISSKFGEMAVGGGGSGSGAGTNATFQLVYNNSISQPEIVTNNTGGALTIRRGSDNGTDNLIEFQDNSGNIVASINGQGLISGTTIAKLNGLNTQFLKADGSVDNNSYLTITGANSNFLKISGGTINGPLNVNNSITVTGNVSANNISGNTVSKIGSNNSEFLMGSGAVSKQYSEIITQNINGINTIFTLSRIFINGTVMVFLNGIKERFATEYGNNQIIFQDPPKNDGYTDLIEVIYFSNQ